MSQATRDAIDAALLHYRENETPKNREMVMERMREHTHSFFEEVVEECMEQQRG